MVVGDITSCLRLNTDKYTGFLIRDDARKRLNLAELWSEDMWVELEDDYVLHIYQAPDPYVNTIWKASIYPTENGQPLLFSGEDVIVEAI